MSKLVGKWEMTSQTYSGDTKAYWNLLEIDGAFYGVSIMGGESVPFKKVKIEGDKFELQVIHDFGAPNELLPGIFGENLLTMTGEYIPETDMIAGTTTFEGGGNSPFEGSRIK